MSFVPPTLSYASPVSGTCPLCQTRPVGKKTIYGKPVCKKCFYKFTNRRQLSYLVDAIVFVIPNLIVVDLLERSLVRSGVSQVVEFLIQLLVGVGLGCLFCLRDGFGGRSPGRRLTGLIVVNEADNQPISFDQSFKRNAILLVGNIPVAGGLAALVVIIVIAVQVGKGYRIGDRFAKTRVVWRRYAELPIFGGNALVCTGCGYSLLGNQSGVCPECGKPIPPDVQAALAVA